MGPFGMDGGGWVGYLVDEEIVSMEAGVTFTALRIEDPERRPLPRWSVAVAGDQRLCSLAHDVATETDPRTTDELQAESGRSGHGSRQVAGETRRLQHDEERLRSSGQGSQATESLGGTSRTLRGEEAATGQIQDEQVHRSPGEQHATDGQPFIEGLRRDHHQPFEADAAGGGLDRIEAPGEIDPGDDRTGCLGLSRQPKDERGSAARAIAADRNARRTRQAAGSQDCIEGRKPGPDDPFARVRCRFRPGRWFWRRQG